MNTRSLLFVLLVLCSVLCFAPYSEAVKADIFTLDCTGSLHALVGTPMEFHMDGKTFVKVANYFMDLVKSRAKCKCPSLTDTEFLTAFVPGKESMTSIFEKQNATNSCLGDVAFLQIAKMNSFSVNLPATCSAAAVKAGQPCFAAFDTFGLNVKLAVDSCPSNAGSTNYLPFVSIACEGNNCLNLGKFCSQDSDCGDSSMVCRTLGEFPANDVFNAWMTSIFGIIRPNLVDMCTDFKTAFSEFAVDIVNTYFGGSFASTFKFSKMSMCTPKSTYFSYNAGSRYIQDAVDMYNSSMPVAPLVVPDEIGEKSPVNAEVASCDLDCGSNGFCSLDANNQPFCYCYNYRYGSACENIATCNGVEATNTTAVCSGRGNCYVPTGAATGTCSCYISAQFYGSNCENEYYCNGLPASNPNACGGNATCSFGNCQCNSGYAGNPCMPITCNGRLASEYGSVCSGNGYCYANGGSSNGYCSCNSGWVGADCETPLTCNGISASNYSSVCSGHGSCNSYSGSSEGVCNCNSGWIGADCGTPLSCNGIPASSYSSVCSGRGSCSKDYQNPNSLNGICSCYYGYKGNNCAEEVQCNGVSLFNSTVCSSKGSCSSSGTCYCNAGYGSNCQLEPICNGLATNSSCGTNGRCYAMSCGGKNSDKCPGKGYCSCNSGFSGGRCEVPTDCNSCNPEGTYRDYYSGQFQCYLKDGKPNCICQNGYSGSKCDKIVTCGAFQRNDTRVCSGRGSCDVDSDNPDSTLGTCSCYGGYFGEFCEKIIPPNPRYTIKGLKSWNGMLATNEMINSNSRKDGTGFLTYTPAATTAANTVTLLSYGCEGQVSFLPGTNLEMRSNNPFLPSVLNKFDAFLFKLRSCDSSFTRELHRILTQIWQGDSWLFYLSQVSRSLVNNYAGDQYHLTPKVLDAMNLVTKFLQMPATCDYNKYKTEGVCQLTYTGLNTLLDTDVKLHLAMGRCTKADRAEALPTFAIQCEGQFCADAVKLRFCSSKSDCSANEACFDVAGQIRNMTSNLTQGFSDYPGYVAFNGNTQDVCSKSPENFLVDIKNLINVMAGREPTATDNSIKICLVDVDKVRSNFDNWKDSAATVTGDTVVVQGLQTYSGSIVLKRDASGPQPSDPVVPAPTVLGNFSVALNQSAVVVTTQGSQAVVTVSAPVPLVSAAGVSVTLVGGSSMQLPSSSASNVVVSVSVTVQSLNLQNTTTVPTRFNIESSTSTTPVGQVVGNGVQIQLGSTSTVTQISNVTVCLKVATTQVADATYSNPKIMFGTSSSSAFVVQTFIPAVYNPATSEMCARITISSTGVSSARVSASGMLYPAFVKTTAPPPAPGASTVISSATSISIAIASIIMLLVL